MDKKEAKRKYNDRVDKILKQKFWNYKSKEDAFVDINNKRIYMDPDEAYEISLSAYDKIIKVEGNSHTSILEKFDLSSDGLCGIGKILAFSSSVEESKVNYRLIREGMFECLVWPCHTQNINICRGFKNPFDDRIDLALVDIQSFYEKIGNKKDISIPLINDIKNDPNNCLLARSYLNLMTFTWLSSFENFNNFIEKRKLSAFVNGSNGEYVAEQWTDNTKKFDDIFFKELINRTKKYRAENKINLE